MGAGGDPAAEFQCQCRSCVESPRLAFAKKGKIQRQGSETICTVGAYALANRQAYMACGQTAQPLRGKGIGGRLIVQMANELAAKGEHPVFLCSPERVHFYTRLGFEKLGEYARYEQTPSVKT